MTSLDSYPSSFPTPDASVKLTYRAVSRETRHFRINQEHFLAATGTPLDEADSYLIHDYAAEHFIDYELRKTDPYDSDLDDGPATVTPDPQYL